MLSLNVGLSRKSSVDYQSQGQSINLTAELDSALLARPAELQRQIAELYVQARQALDQAANAPPAGVPTQRTNGTAKTNGKTNGSTNAVGNGYANGQQNGPTNSRQNGRTEPPMTASQRRAIFAIAQRQQIDAQTECLDEFGCDLAELTIRQASLFIDHLNTLTGAATSPRKAGVR